MNAAVVWQIAFAVITSLGGGGVIVFGLSSFLGKVWADRLALAERKVFEKDIESYRNELNKLAEERRDALIRKRDVYRDVVRTMRIHLAGSSPSADAKDAFLLAFDLAVLWASEDVAQSLVDFLNMNVVNSAKPGSITNEQFKDAYRNCVNSMRRDCGFPTTKVDYPVLTFR
jgi:hypothetical protein